MATVTNNFESTDRITQPLAWRRGARQQRGKGVKDGAPIIGPLPAELCTIIFSFADRIEHLKNGLVCRAWRRLTIVAWKDSNKQDLGQILDRLTTQPSCAPFINALTGISESFKTPPAPSLSFYGLPLSNQEDSPEQIDTAFWEAKGKVLRVIKKLTQENRGQLKLTIGPQLPITFSNIFELATLSVRDALLAKTHETFLVVITSCTPLLQTDYLGVMDVNIIRMARLGAVKDPVSVPLLEAEADGNRTQMKELLPTAKEGTRYVVATSSLKKGDLDMFDFIVKLDPPLSFADRKLLVETGIKENKFGAVLQLLDLATIKAYTDFDWAWLVKTALENKRHEAVKSLLGLRKLSSADCSGLIRVTVKQNNLDTARSILDLNPISDSFFLSYLAKELIEQNKVDFAQLLLAHRYIHVTDLAVAILTSSNLSFSSRLSLGKLLLKNAYQYNFWRSIASLVMTLFVVTMIGIAVKYNNELNARIAYLKSLTNQGKTAATS